LLEPSRLPHLTADHVADPCIEHIALASLDWLDWQDDRTL